MKRILLVIIILASFTHLKSNAQCAWTYSINGNDVTFNHLWPLAGIYTLDSIRLNYGDNTTQLKVSPNIGASTLHTYPGPGTYYACIIRYISSLGNPGVPIPCTHCDSIVIPSTNNCFVNAGFNNSVAGNTASFTNTTNCAVCTSITYSWDFGDGSPLSTATSPSHTYAAPGNYNVCLIATGVNPNLVTCSDTFCTNIIVAATPTPCIANANFTFSSTGLTTSFTNTSTVVGGNITSYTWNFGDASPTSNLMSPSHTYAAAGTYNVCLAITGVDSNQNTCVDDTCFQVTVSAQNTPCVANPNFTFSVNQYSASFTSTGTCTNCASVTYAWNFGNGQTSTLQNPTHVYTTNGTYNVCLIVTGTTANMQTCKDTVCKTVLVNATGVKNVHFNALALYPNPTKDQVWVELPTGLSSKSLVIKDLTGRILEQKILNPSGSKRISLNVQHLSKGVYLVQVNTNEGTYISKLSIE